MSLEEQKRDWRDELEARRRMISVTDGAKASDAIASRLAEIGLLDAAEVVAGYWPIGGEVDLKDFLRGLRKKGKTVCLPRRRPGEGPLDYELAEPERGNPSFDDGLEEGGFGIMEPTGGETVDRMAVDAWLVPGVGFDRDGNRLGRGGGVYDVLLEGAPGLKIGVGYECQLVENLPAGGYDRKMDVIVTEKETIWVR